MNKEHFDVFDQPPYNETSKTIALPDEQRKNVMPRVLCSAKP